MKCVGYSTRKPPSHLPTFSSEYQRKLPERCRDPASSADPSPGDLRRQQQLLRPPARTQQVWALKHIIQSMTSVNQGVIIWWLFELFKELELIWQLFDLFELICSEICLVFHMIIWHFPCLDLFDLFVIICCLFVLIIWRLIICVYFIWLFVIIWFHWLFLIICMYNYF